MWEMLDSDLECGDECGGPGPPPEFLIPPPPRPPFLHELTKCTEDPLPDLEMCEVIPIIDASYQSSPSFQTSAIIILCSVLLLLVITVSSLIVWKHKRKVQNFCKTPTRGGHLPSGGELGGDHVTYEDPDAHLGNRPLVMRHHHTMEMLHPKTIHYPSGYPMPRSPPLFICSSPGPDPYRSHDNVYEELEHPRDTDSEPAIQSDDDFAEDELSLPGDRSFNKLSPETLAATATAAPPLPPITTGVSTIFHNTIAHGGSMIGGLTTSTSSSDQYNLERNRTERNSLLSSSSSSGNDNNNRQIRNSNSSSDNSVTNNNNNNPSVYNNNNNNISNNNNSSGLFRTRNKLIKTMCKNYSADELNTSSETNHSDVIVPTIYGDRNLMTLPSNYNNNNINSNNINNNDNINNNNSNRNNYYSVINDGGGSGGDSEVERRNRINSQLSKNTIATIYRDRDNNNRYQLPPTAHNHYHQHQLQNNINNNSSSNNNNSTSNRSRTNPRSNDRRRFLNGSQLSNQQPTPPPQQQQQSPSPYIYQEPVFHEGILYDACLSHHTLNDRNPIYPYLLPELSTFRNIPTSQSNPNQLSEAQTAAHPLPPTSQFPQAIYTRDSSFGSDSGYSQHTHTSNRSNWGGRRQKDQAANNSKTASRNGAYDAS